MLMMMIKIAKFLYDIADYLMVKSNKKPWFSICSDIDELDNNDSSANRLPIEIKWNDNLIKTLLSMGYVGKTEYEIVHNFLDSLINVNKNNDEEKIE